MAPWLLTEVPQLPGVAGVAGCHQQASRDVVVEVVRDDTHVEKVRRSGLTVVDWLASSKHRVLTLACRYGLWIGIHPDGGTTSARAVPVPARAKATASPIAASALASPGILFMSLPHEAQVSKKDFPAC
jgi:hypothetical protein